MHQHIQVSEQFPSLFLAVKAGILKHKLRYIPQQIQHNNNHFLWSLAIGGDQIFFLFWIFKLEYVLSQTLASMEYYSVCTRYGALSSPTATLTHNGLTKFTNINSTRIVTRTGKQTFRAPLLFIRLLLPQQVIRPFSETRHGTGIASYRWMIGYYMLQW
jgi:hypothetical protein